MAARRVGWLGGGPAVMVVQSSRAALPLLVMLALLHRSVGFNGTSDALHMVLTKTEQYFFFIHTMGFGYSVFAVMIASFLSVTAL